MIAHRLLTLMLLLLGCLLSRRSLAADPVHPLPQIELTAPSPPVVDTEPPVVVIRTPLNHSQVRGATNITMDITDNRQVTRASVTVDGIIIRTLFGPPWECVWKVPSGAGKPYTITVHAIDQSGNNAVQQITVTSK